ncbi:hypothetical protein EVAR_78929_1 [Eumeta japonica]|uniref:Uncharacterized protein n=1 Tax=Eumeta variegata TaxID=151549 RepID=A0A4C1U2S1_EUMVA|nr:hypothetical protein EVAR_78929_1 [Eumeta japonica]
MPEWKGRVPLTRSHCERITGNPKDLSGVQSNHFSVGRPRESPSSRCIVTAAFRNSYVYRCYIYQEFVSFVVFDESKYHNDREMSLVAHASTAPYTI